MNNEPSTSNGYTPPRGPWVKLDGTVTASGHEVRQSFELGKKYGLLKVPEFWQRYAPTRIESKRKVLGY